MTDQQSAELMVQGRDVPWLLKQWVSRTPEKPFLIWAPHEGDHITWTYQEFNEDVLAISTAMQQHGIKRGDRILIHLENSPEFLIAYFACAYLGAVAVLTSPRATVREIQYFCEHTEVTVAVTQTRFISLVEESTDNLKCIFLVDDGEITPKPINNHPSRRVRWQEALFTPPYVHLRSPDPMLDLRVKFTSGTTSLPKAVLSTHANSIFAAQQTAQQYALKHDDVCQVLSPLFHNNGLAVQVMSTLWVGGTLLLQPKFSASNFWEPALKYKATWTSLPGSFFIQALLPYPVPKHHFRFWYLAVLPDVEAHFKVKTRGHWGMTEMIALPIVGDPHHNGPTMNIGRPAPGTQIAIRNEDGSPTQPGETGELFVKGVRGITIFKEYLNNPEANRDSFDEHGWFKTGDRIRMDTNGNLYFADRKKDMLRVGGENVAASELESVIYQTGWIKECAVVGQKHHMLEEVPVTFVIPNEHAPQNLKEALIDHCCKQLASHKVIRDVHILDDFPRATLGKIAKHKLRDSLPKITK